MQHMQLWRPDFEKGDTDQVRQWHGLVTVVVQDSKTKEVLMVAHSNEEALKKTLETGMATFFTRSRGRLWTKGEESGNFMRVKRVLVDCDGDAILYLVEPQGDGKACHTLATSCFYRDLVIGRDTLHDAPEAGKAEDLGVMFATVESGLT